MKNYKKGFTLIELLVVIAIIGILSGIVLASVSSARSKGEDAAIQTTLSNMRAQAEIFYASSTDYGTYAAAGACDTNTATLFSSTAASGGLKNLVTDLAKKATSANTYCSATSTAWAAAAKLKGAGVWCVDSTGISRGSTTISAVSSAISNQACN